MASKKRKKSSSKQRAGFFKWSIYIISIIVTIMIIFNISMIFMENMSWYDNMLSFIILPTLLGTVGISTVICLPWLWFKRKSITQDYMEFRDTVSYVLSEQNS